MKSNAGHLQLNIHKENVAFYKDLFQFLGWKVIYDDPNGVGVVDSHGVSFWFGEGA